MWLLWFVDEWLCDLRAGTDWFGDSIGFVEFRVAAVFEVVLGQDLCLVCCFGIVFCVNSAGWLGLCSLLTVLVGWMFVYVYCVAVVFD